MTLDKLLKEARHFDFAVLVATADDVTISREITDKTPRDNIILELGIFMGTLGRERAYVLTPADPKPVKLPSDLLGHNYLTYTERSDGDKVAALNAAVSKIKQKVDELGPTPWNRPGDGSVHLRSTHTASIPTKQPTTLKRNSDERQLDDELDLLQKCARDQGWVVKAGPHALRFSKEGHRRHTLQVSDPMETRRELRSFVAEMRGDGLRVTHTLRRLPPELDPWSG